MQDLINLLNQKPYEVWKKIKNEEIKINDFDFNGQALFVNLCVQYGLVPQVQSYFKNNPEFLFKYSQLMGTDLEVIFKNIREQENLKNDTKTLKTFLDVISREIFHQVISFDFTEPLGDDFKDGKFLEILIDGLKFSIKNQTKISQFSQEFEAYMNQEFATFYQLFPTKLPINCFEIYKILIESPTISSELKKKIVAFMLNKQEFYGFDYVKAIEINPELLSFKEIYNNLQPKQVAQLLNHALNTTYDKISDKEGISDAEIIKLLLENMNLFIEEAFKYNDEVDNKKFVLKIINAINDGLVEDIEAQEDKEEILDILCQIPKFQEMFAQENVEPNEIVLKILAGDDYQIRDRYALATSKDFIDNFDQILKVTLNDKAVSRDLISAIAVAIINKLKSEHGLDLDIKITNDTSRNSNAYGYYADSEKTFYLNPSYIQDGNEVLVKVINTIYHEIEHAKQYQHQLPAEKNKTTGISYETYLMIVDEFMREASLMGQYYKDNYAWYSLEVAARREAAKETSNLVLKYNQDLKAVCEKLDIQLSPQVKYMRFGFGKIERNTVIKSFIDTVRFKFEIDSDIKDNPEYAGLEPESTTIKKLFADYPFLKNIFYVDFDKQIIEPQSREKIATLLNEATNEADKDLYRGILVDYEIIANLTNPKSGITSSDEIPESAKKL